MDLTKEPNPPFPVEIIDTKPTEVENPYSGQKVTLQPTAIAVYDCIKGAEALEDYDTMQKGLASVSYTHLTLPTIYSV